MRISDWSSDVCSSDLHQATGGKAAIVRAEDDIILQRQLFMRIIAADQPVEHIVEGRSLRPEFLGEGLELTMGVGIAVEQVGPAIIVIAIILALVMAIGGYAGQLGRSEEHTSELQSLMRISYAVFCLKKK